MHTDIESRIRTEHYFDGASSHNGIPVVHCILILQNGGTAIGTSFDAVTECKDTNVLRRIAKQKAIAAVYAIRGKTTS